MEEPRFCLEFSITQEECAEAYRRVRFFRLGHRKGIAILVLMGAFGSVLFLIGLFVMAVGTEKNPVALLMGIVIMVAIGYAVITALRSSAHPLQVDAESQIVIDEMGITHVDGGVTRTRGWHEFTALAWSEHVYIVLTFHSHMIIPRRTVPADVARLFEIYVRGKCLKQGPSREFPVIFPASNMDSADDIQQHD